MRHLTALALTMTLATQPLLAEDSPEKGVDLMQEGARILLRGLMAEMAPHISKMEELARILGDFDQYEVPEVLPNGDVLIRRKPPAALPPPEEGETDL